MLTCTEKRTEDRVGCQDGSGEDDICVDEVVHNRQKHQNHAETEWNTGRDTDHEVDAWRICPCEPEQADCKADTANHTSWKTRFWGCEAIVSSADLYISLVVEDGVCDCEDHADGDTKEGKTANTLRPTAVLLVDDWECAEKHVPR